MENPLIAIMTDFGADSHYTGVMKGVIKKINPKARIVDLTHSIQPFNVLHAMYILERSVDYFPTPTIFLSVVDPGVGSSRRPIVATGEKHYYVTPDNGTISRVIKPDDIKHVIHVDEDHYFLPSICQTFQGRDVFAPIAAWLSKSLGVDRFGEPIEDFVTIKTPKIKIVSERTLTVSVLFVDHFGNIVTHFERSFLEHARERFPGNTLKVKAGDVLIDRLSTTYSDGVEPGKPVAYFGSMDLLEIGVREGNAAQELKLKPGDLISIYLGE